MHTIKITINEDDDDEQVLELPAKWEICGACDGNGTELYGSLKGADVTEMIADDPEFGEEYHRGRYDVACSCCKGSGKRLEVDENRLTPEQAKAYQAHCDYVHFCHVEDARDAHTRRQERGGYDG